MAITTNAFLTSLILASTMLASSLSGEPVAVRHTEGIARGFLVLRTLDGKALADGDLIQTARGTTVTSRLIFRFKDGSIHDETAVFSQRQQFRLLRDHLVQKGPTFPRPLDMSIDVAAGEAVVRYADDDGKDKTESEHMQFEPDLANGILLTLLKNIRSDAPPKSVTFVAATPKPQIVKLEIGVAGREGFSTGGAARTATHYVVKVNIGGLKGVIAPLLGKQPPDSHVWILGGEAPAFVKSEQPLYMGGPVWRVELVSPVWPRAASPKTLGKWQDRATSKHSSAQLVQHTCRPPARLRRPDIATRATPHEARLARTLVARQDDEGRTHPTLATRSIAALTRSRFGWFPRVLFRAVKSQAADREIDDFMAVPRWRPG